MTTPSVVVCADMFHSYSAIDQRASDEESAVTV
jgi:hypothetical protein